jgi:hypothetical protein
MTITRQPDWVLNGAAGVRTHQVHMRAECLHLFFHPGGRALRHINALGSVRVRFFEGDRALRCEGVGETAAYDVSAGSVELGGWPQATAAGEQFSSTSAATRLVLDLEGVRVLEPAVAGPAAGTRARTSSVSALGLLILKQFARKRAHVK